MPSSSFFITICTKSRRCIFAHPDKPQHITLAGSIVRDCWISISNHTVGVLVDEFVVMPNHIHGILTFDRYVETTQNYASANPGSLITIIKSFKSAVTKKINRLPNVEDYVVWQRGFYDHRIRSNHELQAYRQYIQKNPQRWSSSFVET